MRTKVTNINLTTPGQEIIPSENVTLIVGPNNVGKSAILAGLHQDLTLEPHHPVNTKDQPVASGNIAIPAPNQYFDTITARARIQAPGSYPHGTFHETAYAFRNGVVIQTSQLATALQQTHRLGPLASVITAFLGPEGRGAVLNPQQVPDLMTNMARSPLQALWEDRDLEAVMDSYMKRAFGKNLIVNRHAGMNIYVQIGSVSSPEPKIGERTEYLDEVMNLPQLSAQGSGMQAFMGTVLTLAAGEFDIVLLDEPEAFLHPPQARLLGKVVAEMSREGGTQVIVSTHSDDFVQGVLDASRDDAEVTVVRLTRPTDSENRVAQVDPDAIKSLYRDPLLRYSNIMDGIFYKGAVICEAESDCTYYSATLGYIEQEEGLGASDLFFTQCGGKDRIKRAYQALAAASVPTAVIADIDLLADKTKFRDLFEAMGGMFAAIEASYNTLESSVKNQKIDPERSVVREAINAILDGSDAKNFTKDELTKLTELLRSESGWKQVKRKGAGAIDTGDPTAAFKSIVAACVAIGLFLVEVGELERFHQDVSGNKQEWLRKVLEQELFKKPTESHALIQQVRSYVSGLQ